MAETGAFRARFLIIAIVALYLFIAMPAAFAPRGIWPDEALFMGATRNFLAGKGFNFNGERGVFPFMPIFSGIVTLFLGFSKPAIYTATVLVGAASVVATYFLAERLLKSERYALLAAVLAAGNHIFLFYSAHALIDVYDSAIATAGLLAIIALAGKPSSSKDAALAGGALTIAYFVRIQNFLVLSATLGIAGLYVLISRKGKFLGVIRTFGLSVAIPALCVFLWSALSGTPILGTYTQQGFTASVIGPNLSPLFQSLTFFLSGTALFNTVLIAMAAAGLWFLLKEGALEAAICAFFSLFVVASRFPAYPFDARYLLSAIPLFSILAVGGIRNLAERVIVDKNKIASFVVCVLIVAGLSWSNLSYAKAMSSSKASGYVEIEQAGDWIAKNTPAGEKVYAGAYRITAFSSGRDALPVPPSEDDFLKGLNSTGIRFIEIDNYDWGAPAYVLNLTVKYPGYFGVAKQFVNQQTGGGAAILTYLPNIRAQAANSSA